MQHSFILFRFHLGLTSCYQLDLILPLWHYIYFLKTFFIICPITSWNVCVPYKWSYEAIFCSFSLSYVFSNYFFLLISSSCVNKSCKINYFLHDFMWFNIWSVIRLNSNILYVVVVFFLTNNMMTRTRFLILVTYVHKKICVNQHEQKHWELSRSLIYRNRPALQTGHERIAAHYRHRWVSERLTKANKWRRRELNLWTHQRASLKASLSCSDLTMIIKESQAWRNLTGEPGKLAPWWMNVCKMSRC